jgi:hypothetical protein
LNRRHVARLYAEELGDSEAFDNRRETGGTDFPRDALVIGLGAPGELTRTLLTDTVTAALVRRALGVADGTPTDEVHTLQVSPMLIGTRGTTPLRVDISVAAIVDAVLAANSRLLELRTRDGRPLLARVRYDAIEFIELHLDRAEVAAHAVDGIGPLVARAPDHSKLRPLPRLVQGQGGWPGQLMVDDDPGWRRILVRGERVDTPDAPLELTYTSVGHTSLSEALVIRPNERVVATLLAKVRPETSAAIAPTLLEALVPEALRDDLLVADNIQFILDEHSARYPWEALVVGREGAAATPASQRGGLIRQFVHTEGGRRRPRGTEARSAVVIGNPPTDLPPLPGAWREALDVSNVLNGRHYQVVTLDWNVDGNAEHVDELALVDPGAQIFHALTFPHRILHIAAHGTADVEGEPGVVVGPGDARLRARDIAELSTIPELVVLNCCHLGADPGLAANLARAFMERGAQAVIAAAWTVSDGPAKAFADRLYSSLLGGATFGVAAHEARNAAADASPDSLTWAAYQCYGDPGYRLEAQARTASKTASTISEGELARQIEITIARSGDIGRTVTDSHVDERQHQITLLQELLADAEVEQGADGRRRPKLNLTAFACSRAAFAFSELGGCGLAVEWYRRAIAQERASFPMMALEQLGNMEIRLAQQLHRDGDTAGAETYIIDSERHLKAALYVGATAERHALMGGYYKKLATMRRPAQRARLLRKAVTSYSCARNIVDADYQRLVWIQLHQLAFGTRPDGVEEVISDIGPWSDARDFWARAAVGDVRLTHLIIGGDVSWKDVAEAYVHAFEMRSSWRERSSVRDHLADVAELCREDRLRSQINDVRSHLDEWIERTLGEAD